MKGKIPYRLQHGYQESTATNKNTKLTAVLFNNLQREESYTT